MLILAALVAGCGGPTRTPPPVLSLPGTPVPTVVLASATPRPIASPTVPLLTAAPTATPSITITPPPTLTPTITSTFGPQARVEVSGEGLYLRTAPGEGAHILTTLADDAPLIVIGRTADGNWLNVITSGGQAGWVRAAYVALNAVDLGAIPVTGTGIVEAIQASPTRPLRTATPTIAAPAVALLPPNARVAAGRSGLRLRATPGSAGTIRLSLGEYTPLAVYGRTADNRWLQVMTPDGLTGWVAAAYVEVNVDVNSLPITGQAISAPAEEVAAAPAANVPAAPAPGPAHPPTLPDVVANISANARQIFRQGQTFGNRANVFSKVGDSITAVSYFLNPIGWGNYDLGSYSYLGPVVDFYRSGVARDGQNSFSNRSFAAENGWTTESVLTPGNRPSDTPDDCLPGEVPLVCELRVVRPAVALIMLGTNDVTYLPIDLYRANLSRIVETCIGMGVIPVLSTLPNRGGLEGQVAAFNDVIVQLAYGYDVPLWDYAAAMRVLPDGGLSGDWVHPNAPPGDLVAYFTPANLYYGYTVRNLTALQVLDAVWRNALR